MGLLTARQREAAVMVAEDSLSDTKIAKHVSISRSALMKWKARRDFELYVEEVAKEMSKRAMERGIARRWYRLKILADKHSDLLSVFEQRAEDPCMAHVPGGRTGLLVRKPILSAGVLLGYDYAVDTGAIHELLEIEAAAAREMGQFIHKHQHAALTVEMVCEWLGQASDSDLSELVEALRIEQGSSLTKQSRRRSR